MMKYQLKYQLKYQWMLIWMLICAAVGMFLFSPQVSYAIDVYVDGSLLSTEAPAEVAEGITMAPMRGIFEALGAQVEWDPLSRAIIATRGSAKIMLAVGQTVAQVNGSPVTLEAAPELVNNTVRVPLRFVSEALGDKVDWNAETKTILITQGDSARMAEALLKEWSVIPEMPDYDKVKAIFDGWIARTTYGYRNDAPGQSATAYGALIQKTATAPGYAKALVMLFNAVGLDARVITGEALGIDQAGVWGAHTWNLVKINTHWYHLDAAMQDKISTQDEMRYCWFNQDDEGISTDHRWSGVYPKCDGVSANYYYRLFNDGIEFLQISSEDNLELEIREAYNMGESDIRVNLAALNYGLNEAGMSDTRLMIGNVIKRALDPIRSERYLTTVVDARDLYPLEYAEGSFILSW
jgi:hypothetical protein